MPFSDPLSSWGLLLVSVVSGVVFLLIYGAISFQQALKRTKRKIYAAVLEAVLFRHDLRTSLSAQGRLFQYGTVYFALAIPPIIVLLIPCLVILAQLELRYGARPLRVGESSVVVLQVSRPELVDKAQLIADPNLAVTPPVRVREKKEIVWRVDALGPGLHQVKVALADGSAAIAEEIPVATHPGRIETGIYNEWWMRMLYPSREKLPAGVIERLSLSYDAPELNFFGWRTHWLVIFALVSIVTGLLASRVFKIEV